jgi:hypothetical protein
MKIENSFRRAAKITATRPAGLLAALGRLPLTESFVDERFNRRRGTGTRRAGGFSSADENG